MRANAAEIGAAVFVGRGCDSLGKHIERRAIQRCFRRCGFGRRRLWRSGGFRFLPFAGRIEHVEINKLVAGGDEGAGRLAFPKTVDGDALLTDAGGEASKVTVARDDAEAGEAAGIEQVHGVDDHCAIGRVLAGRIGELLDRLNRMFEQAFLPALQVGAGPVAVDALDARHAIIGDLGQEADNDLRRGVVAIDQ